MCGQDEKALNIKKAEKDAAQAMGQENDAARDKLETAIADYDKARRIYEEAVKKHRQKEDWLLLVMSKANILDELKTRTGMLNQLFPYSCSPAIAHSPEPLCRCRENQEK